MCLEGRHHLLHDHHIKIPVIPWRLAHESVASGCRALPLPPAQSAYAEEASESDEESVADADDVSDHRQQQAASHPQPPPRQHAATEPYTGLPYAHNSVAEEEEDGLPGMGMFDDRSMVSQ